MAITAEEARKLKKGDTISDGNVDWKVTKVTPGSRGEFRVDLESKDDVSFFTQEHIDLVTKVGHAAPPKDEKKEAPKETVK